MYILLFLFTSAHHFYFYFRYITCKKKPWEMLQEGDCRLLLAKVSLQLKLNLYL